MANNALPIGNKLQGARLGSDIWPVQIMSGVAGGYTDCFRHKSVHILDCSTVECVEPKEPLVSPVPCDATVRWEKPPTGTMKVNVDRAWLVQGRLAAVGVIARDHHGLMLDGTHSAEKVKACAFEEGVHMATMHGWQQVIVEGDTISTLNRLRAYDPDRSVAATNLAETTMLLRANTHISIGHVTRTVNRVRSPA
ncbi:hypothetical protein V6N11_034131 [Hibiscus sabdariffa]|uniref:RNase H type-1 domain-containing protein n=1 Tax=Hibiscus sabdariffa TaxID=183260 RepID=A0ABR2S1I7_9ROSI